MAEPRPKKVPGWRQPWYPWRVTMLAGSLVLLAAAIGRGIAGGLPNWVEIAAQFLGFGLLATGFALAMRMRREIREGNAAAPKKEVSRGDQG